MRNIRTLLLLFSFIVFLSSCSTLNIVGRSTPSVNMNAQFNFTTEDLEFLGEVNGTSSQSYVLGFPVGGRRKFYANVGIAHSGLINGPFGNRNRGYNNALYDALSSKSNADFILPISVSYTIQRQFLGRKVYINIKGKAFKLKEKKVGEEKSMEKEEKPVLPQEETPVAPQDTIQITPEK